jgi:DNA-binding transcriptional LysR family regulator
MNTIQLEYFIASARNGSFSETAKEFFTTQPTVSRQISLLEDELGFTLFKRDEKPLRLTTAGSVLYEEFPALLEQQKALIHRGQMAAKGNYGTISIGFCEHLQIEKEFSKIYEDLRIGCPGLTMNIEKIYIDQIREQILARQLDVALTLHTRVLDSPELDIIDLEKIKSYVLVGKSNPLADKEFLSEEDLYHEKFYLAGSIPGYSIHNNILCGFHMDRNNIVNMPNVPSVLINVRFANGVTLVNNFMDGLANLENYRLFPVLDDSQNPQICLVSRRKTSNAAVSFFRDLTKAHFRQK